MAKGERIYPKCWYVFHEPFGDWQPHYSVHPEEADAREVAAGIERLGGKVLAVRRGDQVLAMATAPVAGYFKATKIHLDDMADRLDALREINSRLLGEA